MEAKGWWKLELEDRDSCHLWHQNRWEHYSHTKDRKRVQPAFHLLAQITQGYQDEKRCHTHLSTA